MKNRVNGAEPGDIVGGQPQGAPTHFAVPIVLFDTMRKILGTLPWDQVNPVMVGLTDCKPLALTKPKVETAPAKE